MKPSSVEIVNFQSVQLCKVYNYIFRNESMSQTVIFCSFGSPRKISTHSSSEQINSFCKVCKGKETLFRLLSLIWSAMSTRVMLAVFSLDAEKVVDFNFLASGMRS